MSTTNPTNLIVNYLPQTLTDEEFRSMFLSIGPLKSSKIIRDKATNYSYGFGFVDYAKEEDAEKAIQTLNGLQLQNKRIKVALARHGESIKGANLYVRNIPRDMTADDLEMLFAQHGRIIQCRILTDQITGKSKGVGFVLFDGREQAESAIAALDGHVPEGGTEWLSVKFAEDNKGKARAPPIQQANFNTPIPGLMSGGYPGGYGGRGGRGAFRGGYGRGGFQGGHMGHVDARPGPMRSQNQNRFNRFNPMGGNNGYGGAGGAAAPAPAPSASGTGSGDGGFTLFVYNIGPVADERALWQLFSPFGEIQKVNVIRDFQKDQGKGYGFVTMNNYHDAMNAIQSLNGYEFIPSKGLQVSFKTPKAWTGLDSALAAIVWLELQSATSVIDSCHGMLNARKLHLKRKHKKKSKNKTKWSPSIHFILYRYK